MTTIRPMLACDFDESKLRFPLMAMPKIDGVRGLNFGNGLVGRSLKPFKNRRVTEMFSKDWFVGLDGEITAGRGKPPVAPDLCRATTSRLNSEDGSDDVSWGVFDYISPATKDMTYFRRQEILSRMVELMPAVQYGVYVVPFDVVDDVSHLAKVEAKRAEQGYEGVILRDPYGKYKEGRATVSEGSFLRIKRFVDAEALVVGIVPGMTNGNEAKVNALGHTERSSHKENMRPNGMVGSLVCRVLGDVVYRGQLLFTADQEITVGAGVMTRFERKHYMENTNELLGKIIKFKSFPYGVKDKPRFPTFLTIRAESDL